jgi:hypothetical protein
MKFKTSRARATKVQTYPIDKPTAPPEPTGGIVQGKITDSKEEFWCAMWLERKKLHYDYQYTVFGGGPKYFYNIDFVVYTVPLWTMIEIYGGHWHDSELGQDDRKRQLEIEDKMRDVAKIPMRILWASDLVNRQTEEAALERIFHET